MFMRAYFEATGNLLVKPFFMSVSRPKEDKEKNAFTSKLWREIAKHYYIKIYVVIFLCCSDSYSTICYKWAKSAIDNVVCVYV